ncbi:1-deoxy-D-xylulose-5-phosphate reductoisomerase [Govanella unica]|uniref:1-deoxy-D-xylulose 5-phosphate reductoisomerase n=1 Tax=Govanella unica TaxID=2975056 RepID=A0A9X3Z748_9PROT|nr:1-deoxy-D-xylulose-5-phosphate reductoisomerase [Govania unica]MDA5193772.1 1-deoxy-D-xylulose-5-phosphate reductoisomerase [Govania unica]
MIQPLLQTATAPRTVSVFGATGSIGCNTLDLVRRNPDAYRIEALTAYRNLDLLIAQALEFRPHLAVIGDASHYSALKAALAGTGIEVAAGDQAVVDAADRPVDLVMAAIVGAAGLEPTLRALRRGAVVALANKECLVCAGELFMREVERQGATLLPVDSEHNAIFQVFDFDRPEAVDRIILTASGGPFRTWDRDSMAQVTPEQAVAHPNWDMGAKISVDSATMFNKGLELIEAFHLFPVKAEQIEILVHPQSVVHSMVSYIDGSVLAQLGSPDMRTPISYALGWPARMETPARRLNLAQIGRLDFAEPDLERFPALRLAREALVAGGNAPTVLNAANEVAVAGFLARKIGFLQIAEIVQTTLETLPLAGVEDLDDVRETDREARRVADAIMRRIE